MSLLGSLFKKKPSSYRPASFAGHYYPQEAEELAQMVSGTIARAVVPDTIVNPPRALVVPFAQLSVMATSCGAAYACIERHAQAYERVVIFAPALRIPFRAMATDTVDAWRTPVGDVWVDAELRDSLLQEEEVMRAIDEAHRAEPSIEVQLPFLHHINPQWRVVPVLVGDGSSEAPAALMEAFWSMPRTLILVCTELSIEAPPEVAQQQDEATLGRLMSCESGFTRGHASARVVLDALMDVARKAGAAPTLLAHHSSADALGEQPLVTTFASVAYS